MKTKEQRKEYSGKTKQDISIQPERRKHTEVATQEKMP
jgi:hypothetical protein